MKASAPASSANLGAGFDALALALDLSCDVEVESGDTWDIADDPDGFVRAAAERLSPHPLCIRVTSDIPVGKGLGSSAAVLAALGTAIARLQGRSDDRQRVFEAVAAVEGHPDNAAAAVYGGLVLAHAGRIRQLQMHPSLSVIVAVPEVSLPTAEARRVLPGEVPFGVATRTSARAMCLLEGLRTGDTALLSTIGRDELHEPFRVSLRPVIGRLLEAADGAGAPYAAISGAGPAVLAVVTDATAPAVAGAFGDIVEQVLNPPVAVEGVR